MDKINYIDELKYYIVFLKTRKYDFSRLNVTAVYHIIKLNTLNIALH